MRRFHPYVFCATAVAVMMAILPVRAIAQSAHAAGVLRYAAPAECPNETVFRELVGARLGYVPFVSASPETRQIDVEIQACTNGQCDGFRATLRLPQARVLTDANCAALASATALTVAIALDPEAAMQATNAPTAQPAPSAPATYGQPGYGAPEPTYDAAGSGLRWPSGAPTLTAQPARRMVRVRFVTDTPNLSVSLGGSRWSTAGSRGWYQTLCVAPCEAELPVGSNYLGLSTGGDVRTVRRPIRVQGGETVRLRLVEHSERPFVVSVTVGAFIVGAVLLGLGGVGAMPSTTFLGDAPPYLLVGGGISLVLGVVFAILSGELRDVVEARVDPR